MASEFVKRAFESLMEDIPPFAVVSRRMVFRRQFPYFDPVQRPTILKNRAGGCGKDSQKSTKIIVIMLDISVCRDILF